MSKYEQLYNAKPGFYSYISAEIHGDRIIDEYFSEVYATPASCQKIITSLVALKTLGLMYQYKTNIFSTMKNNQINDVVIKFSGDPTLTSSQLTTLLKPLQGKKINGYIFLDASHFETPPYSHNLMIGDIGTDYATPVSAINIDKNFISVKILATKMGKLATIKIDKNFNVNSKVITNKDKSSIKLTWEDNVIHIMGNINIEDSITEFKISPKNHDQYILNKTKAILSYLNIKGKIKIIKDESVVDVKKQFIGEIHSLPLKDFIKPALKMSDNLVFDSLYLSIANSYADEKIKDWEQGNNIIKNLINENFGIDADNALFVDGSGLSRYNRIQPKTLLSLLKIGFNIPQFVDALSISGEAQSTLENRLQLSRNIRAKTGNLSGITCLCGYSSSTDVPKAFVFMGNSFAPPSKKLFQTMDSFITKNIGQ
ncbi:MAG: dacB [Francisellaceae bacterium]|nr:dacB [Francisellaceae bacterium]